MSIADMRQLVNDGVPVFGAVELQAVTLQQSIAALDSIIDRGQALGMVGALRAAQFKAQLAVASGQVAQALSSVLDVHIACTIIAQNNSVDVPDPNAGGRRQL